ncbi:protein FAM185A isoform X2 [Seriola dumerili]|uniref:Family with sequence similarity 185 member A n=1 Tax=Seriola dumerili TaxID=41447 RepID=A0A3B4UUF2_SERDU|nr:protein FAM185A isoform X2 [Seriola dumerili]
MAAFLIQSSAGQRGCVGLLRCWSLTVSPRTLITPRCPLHTSRSFYSSAPAKSPTHVEVNQPLKQWALEVSPFCTVRAQLACSISIRPLDLHAFPEADRAFITVHGTDAEQQEVDLDHLRVHYDDQSKELLISAEKVNSNVSIDLAAPIKSNLYINTQGNGNVAVKKMECDICKVQTERGNCLLHSVKGHQVKVQSNGGHVTGVGTIHGNVDISTCGDSAVDVKKLQGTEMTVSTEHGPLKVKAIYAESSCISSCSGRVQLGHVHGNATVKNVSGDTVIDGSNSFLKVSSHSGGIDVYVGDSGSAELHSQEGAVCVRVPSTLRAGVELRGSSVEISPEMVLHEVENNTTQGQTTVTGYMNGASPVDQWVKAQADRGSVRLRTQSWFESLKLGS